MVVVVGTVANKILGLFGSIRILFGRKEFQFVEQFWGRKMKMKGIKGEKGDEKCYWSMLFRGSSIANINKNSITSSNDQNLLREFKFDSPPDHKSST